MGLAAVDSPPGAPHGDLFGRAHELEAVAQALETSRLVTLTGPPGIGKTRLALAVAADRPEPTVVVELTAVADASLVPIALASALSVQDAPDHSLMETLAATLRHRGPLLLLDNCEHLRDGCALTVAELLDRCAHLTVLATSREPLEVQGERVCPVAPLLIPERGHESDPEAMLGYPAITLFVERAAATQRGFRLTAQIAGDVADICRRLDGIPLAIELAAARMGTMTAHEIARRLEAHLGLLSEHPRGPLPRHHTLTSALDWSHALLSDAERTVLHRLSVFAGTFEPDAAAAVCGDEIADHSEIPDLLDRLVSKSLVVRDADADRPARYRLLETVRTYSAEKLEQAGTAAQARTLHARFYTLLAERAEPEFTGPSQLEWFDRMTSERSNLRAAIDWSLAHGRPDEALRLSGALVLFWRVRGPYSEGRDLLRAALAAGGEDPDELRVKALWGAGFMTLMTGDHACAIPSLEESLALYRELGDQQGCARALLVLANASVSGSDTRAPAMLEESLRLARACGDHWCLAHALGLAAWDAYSREDLHEARSMFEECVAVARDAGDLQGLRFGLIGLGGSASQLGDPLVAEAVLCEAVEVTSVLREDYDRAEALRTLGGLATTRGDYDRARSLLEEALSLIPEFAPPQTRSNALFSLAVVARMQGDFVRARTLLGDLRGDGGVEISVLVELGSVAMDEHDLSAARRLYQEALELARSQGHKRGAATAFVGLAHVASCEGDLQAGAKFLAEAFTRQRHLGYLPGIVGTLGAASRLAARAHEHERAARLFGAAEALGDRVGVCSHPNDQYRADLARVQQLVGIDAFDRARAEGRALDLDHALAEVLAGRHPAAPVGGWASLSDREVTVALMAAEGFTNMEIAERLAITPETVKTHLSHIFAKLGVSGRAMIASAFESRSTGRLPAQVERVTAESEPQTEADAYGLLEALRWPDGEPTCPHCGSSRRPYFLTPTNGRSRKTSDGSLSQRRVWKCAECRKQFSVLTGTILHGSKLPVRIWFLVIRDIVRSGAKGLSARDIARKHRLSPANASLVVERLRDGLTREPLASVLPSPVPADNKHT